MDGNDDQSRLPSFEGPRNLTLVPPRGRVTLPGRRSFRPNLNAARDPNKPATSVETKPEQKKNDSGRGGAESGRGRGSRGGRRGKPREEYIQSEGIFSEGIGSGSVDRRSRAATYLGKEDSGAGGSSSFVGARKSEGLLGNALHKSGNRFDAYRNGAEEDGNAYRPSLIPLIANTEISSFLSSLRLSDTAEGSMLLLRLPDDLPVVQTQAQEESMTEVSPNNIDDVSALDDGLLGTMEIDSHGNAALKIGENSFAIEPGNQIPFNQELLLFKDEDLISLGPIRQKFICKTNVDLFLEGCT